MRLKPAVQQRGTLYPHFHFHKREYALFFHAQCGGGKRKKTGSLFATRKDDVHGFGLRRAEAILEEHGGWVKYNSEDGAFTSEFLVPAIE